MRLSMVGAAALFSVMLGGCAYVQPAPVQPDTPDITVDGVPLEVEVADTEVERNQGLSWRENLDEGKGMLFVYDTPGTYEFWMYGMRFPLDFVWIAEGKVVGVSENVPAPSLESPVPARVRPPEPVTKILEVPAGWVERHGIAAGAEVR